INRWLSRALAQVVPTHPGRVIAVFLEKQGISLRQVARALGMTPTALNKVLIGLRPVTPEIALRRGVWFGNGPEIWLRLQQEHDLWRCRTRLLDDLAQIKRSNIPRCHCVSLDLLPSAVKAKQTSASCDQAGKPGAGDGTGNSGSDLHGEALIGIGAPCKCM